MTQVFKIPDSLESKYHGAGHAICAVTGGQIIDLVYIRDILEDYDEEDKSALRNAINDERIGPTVRNLQALGEVFVGMCSCWEFVEL